MRIYKPNYLNNIIKRIHTCILLCSFEKNLALTTIKPAESLFSLFYFPILLTFNRFYLQTAALKFLNTLLKTSPRPADRIRLQCELEEAGLDIEALDAVSIESVLIFL